MQASAGVDIQDDCQGHCLACRMQHNHVHFERWPHSPFSHKTEPTTDAIISETGLCSLFLKQDSASSPDYMSSFFIPATPNPFIAIQESHYFSYPKSVCRTACIHPQCSCLLQILNSVISTSLLPRPNVSVSLHYPGHTMFQAHYHYFPLNLPQLTNLQHPTQNEAEYSIQKMTVSCILQAKLLFAHPE